MKKHTKKNIIHKRQKTFRKVGGFGFTKKKSSVEPIDANDINVSILPNNTPGSDTKTKKTFAENINSIGSTVATGVLKTRNYIGEQMAKGINLPIDSRALRSYTAQNRFCDFYSDDLKKSLYQIEYKIEGLNYPIGQGYLYCYGELKQPASLSTGPKISQGVEVLSELYSEYLNALMNNGDNTISKTLLDIQNNFDVKELHLEPSSSREQLIYSIIQNSRTMFLSVEGEINNQFVANFEEWKKSINNNPNIIEYVTYVSNVIINVHRILTSYTNGRKYFNALSEEVFGKFKQTVQNDNTLIYKSLTWLNKVKVDPSKFSTQIQDPSFDDDIRMMSGLELGSMEDFFEPMVSSNEEKADYIFSRLFSRNAGLKTNDPNSVLLNKFLLDAFQKSVGKQCIVFELVSVLNKDFANIFSFTIDGTTYLLLMNDTAACVPKKEKVIKGGYNTPVDTSAAKRIVDELHRIVKLLFAGEVIPSTTNTPTANTVGQSSGLKQKDIDMIMRNLGPLLEFSKYKLINKWGTNSIPSLNDIRFVKGIQENIFKNSLFVPFMRKEYLKKHRCKGPKAYSCNTFNELRNFTPDAFISIDIQKLIMLMKYQYMRTMTTGKLDNLHMMMETYKRIVLSKPQNILQYRNLLLWYARVLSNNYIGLPANIVASLISISTSLCTLGITNYNEQKTIPEINKVLLQNPEKKDEFLSDVLGFKHVPDEIGSPIIRGGAPVKIYTLKTILQKYTENIPTGVPDRLTPDGQEIPASQEIPVDFKSDLGFFLDNDNGKYYGALTGISELKRAYTGTDVFNVKFNFGNETINKTEIALDSPLFRFSETEMPDFYNNLPDNGEKRTIEEVIKYAFDPNYNFPTDAKTIPQPKMFDKHTDSFSLFPILVETSENSKFFKIPVKIEIKFLQEGVYYVYIYFSKDTKPLQLKSKILGNQINLPQIKVKKAELDLIVDQDKSPLKSNEACKKTTKNFSEILLYPNFVYKLLMDYVDPAQYNGLFETEAQEFVSKAFIGYLARLIAMNKNNTTVIDEIKKTFRKKFDLFCVGKLPKDATADEKTLVASKDKTKIADYLERLIDSVFTVMPALQDVEISQLVSNNISDILVHLCKLSRDADMYYEDFFEISVSHIPKNPNITERNNDNIKTEQNKPENKYKTNLPSQIEELSGKIEENTKNVESITENLGKLKTQLADILGQKHELVMKYQEKNKKLSEILSKLDPTRSITEEEQNAAIKAEEELDLVIKQIRNSIDPEKFQKIIKFDETLQLLETVKADINKLNQKMLQKTGHFGHISIETTNVAANNSKSTKAQPLSYHLINEVYELINEFKNIKGIVKLSDSQTTEVFTSVYSAEYNRIIETCITKVQDSPQLGDKGLVQLMGIFTNCMASAPATLCRTLRAGITDVLQTVLNIASVGLWKSFISAKGNQLSCIYPILIAVRLVYGIWIPGKLSEEMKTTLESGIMIEDAKKAAQEAKKAAAAKFELEYMGRLPSANPMSQKEFEASQKMASLGLNLEDGVGFLTLSAGTLAIDRIVYAKTGYKLYTNRIEDEIEASKNGNPDLRRFIAEPPIQPYTSNDLIAEIIEKLV